MGFWRWFDMNSSLRRASHKKKMLYNSYRKCKVPWETYRKHRHLTTAINKQSKATSFTDTQEICEIFNSFLTSVGNNIGFDDAISPNYYTDEGFSPIIEQHCSHPSITKVKENNAHSDMFHFQSMDHSDVVKIINDFDSNKTQGYDRMPMIMLQKSVKYIASANAKIINDSITKCVFPNSLKLAEVSSLFIKKYTLIKTNYRPVSILVASSKSYERAVGVQLTGYFNAFFQL